MRGKPLKPEIVALVVEACRIGVPPKELAETFRVRPATIRRYARRAGLKFHTGPRTKTELRKRIAELYRSGCTYRQVRERTGAGSATIRLALLEAGIEGRRCAPRARIDKEAIRRLSREGQGCRRIGRVLGCSPQYVRAVMRRETA